MVQRLLQIAAERVDPFEPDRQPQHAGQDACVDPLLRRHVEVRRVEGQARQRLDATEAGRLDGDTEPLAAGFVDRFAVVGLSGGGPYALATAAVLGAERVVAVGILGGVCPVVGATASTNAPASTSIFATGRLPR